MWAIVSLFVARTLTMHFTRACSIRPLIFPRRNMKDYELDALSGRPFAEDMEMRQQVVVPPGFDCRTRLDDGRYVPAQPLPPPGANGLFRRLKCSMGHHRPGTISDGWFCKYCLKQLKK